jgi:hypothetical protein
VAANVRVADAPETFRVKRTTRQPSALAAAMAGIRLTPVPAATRAKMLANWSLSKMACGADIEAALHAEPDINRSTYCDEIQYKWPGLYWPSQSMAPVPVI